MGEPARYEARSTPAIRQELTHSLSEGVARVYDKAWDKHLVVAKKIVRQAEAIESDQLLRYTMPLAELAIKYHGEQQLLVARELSEQMRFVALETLDRVHRLSP